MTENTTIFTDLTYASSFNPRGSEFTKGEAFKDLVASVREQGVLMPVLVRRRKKGKKEFEVIAGNRRLAAAQVVGLKELPARIVEMTDAQAREAQIVENLQREDVHPLEEGAAYKHLVDERRIEASEIAKAIGKSEDYVRGRIVLTNLSPKAAEIYRSGVMRDGQALVIARLSHGDQDLVVKEVGKDWATTTIADLKEWITKNLERPLKFQPWLKNKELMELVGPCTSCPVHSADLFGAIRPGACLDLGCWEKKMEKYVAHIVKTEKLPRISTEYYSVPKGMIGQKDYETVSTKPKEQCKYAERAIVAHQPEMGTVKMICRKKQCPIHQGRYASAPSTPAQKAARKREIQKQKDKVAAAEALVQKAIAKVHAPIDRPVLEILIDLMVAIVGPLEIAVICKRRGITPSIVKEKNWNNKMIERKDYPRAFRAALVGQSQDEKAQVLVELVLEKAWSDPKEKALKELLK